MSEACYRTLGSGGDCDPGIVSLYPSKGGNHYSAPGDSCQEVLAWLFLRKVGNSIKYLMSACYGIR